MAHHTAPNGDTYVDTAFINKTKAISGVSIGHMGFGEFYADTPKGRVEFDRMRGKDFPGKSGRSHKLYGDGKAAEWLVEQMERAGKSDRVASSRKASLRASLVRLASQQTQGSPERKALLTMLKQASKSDFPSDVKSDYDKLYDRLNRYYNQARREGGPEMKNHLALMRKVLDTAVGLNAHLHRAEEALYY